MTTAKRRRIRQFLAVSAALMVLTAALVASGTWYTVSAGDSKVAVTGSTAWPALAQVCLVQAGLTLLALYLKRTGSIISTATNLSISFVAVWFTINVLRDSLPATLQVEFAKQTGILADFTEVLYDENRLIFVLLQSAALALLVAATSLGFGHQNEQNVSDRFVRNDKNTDQSDPISLWDSQR